MLFVFNMRVFSQTQRKTLMNERTLIIGSWTYVYVGRPTKWGNPYSHLGVPKCAYAENREDAVNKYRDHVNALIKSGLLDPSELTGHNLVCWCAPLACHANYLLELANDI